MPTRILALLVLALAHIGSLPALSQTITPDDAAECVAVIDGNDDRVGRLDGGDLYLDTGDSVTRVILTQEGPLESGILYFPSGPTGCSCIEQSGVEPWVDTFGNRPAYNVRYAYDQETATLYTYDRTAVPEIDKTLPCRLDVRTDSCESGSFTLASASPAATYQLSGFIPPFRFEAEPCSGPAAASIDTLGLVAVASLILLTGARLLLAREARRLEEPEGRYL